MKRVGLWLAVVLWVAGCAYGVTSEDAEPQSQRLGERRVGVDDGSSDVGAERSWRALDAGVYQEDEACAEIFEAYKAWGLTLRCAVTLPVCPGLLQEPFGACLQYDAASVDECVEIIERSETCEELWSVSCDVRPIADSQPAGCGEP